MATTAGAEFTSVLTYNGSNYGDMTLEAQSPAGTSFGAFVETSHFLYLGHEVFQKYFLYLILIYNVDHNYYSLQG